MFLNLETAILFAKRCADSDFGDVEDRDLNYEYAKALFNGSFLEWFRQTLTNVKMFSDSKIHVKANITFDAYVKTDQEQSTRNAFTIGEFVQLEKLLTYIDASNANNSKSVSWGWKGVSLTDFFARERKKAPLSTYGRRAACAIKPLVSLSSACIGKPFVPFRLLYCDAIGRFHFILNCPSVTPVVSVILTTEQLVAQFTQRESFRWGDNSYSSVSIADLAR
jgi:hypothetical protein